MWRVGRAIVQLWMIVGGHRKHGKVHRFLLRLNKTFLHLFYC